MPSPFQNKIYQLAKQIPKGKVATYGQLAKLAGNPKAARAVGLFMRTNHDPINIPCYKVVAANGKLTGYSAGKGIKTKKQKLLQDGVTFTGEKVDLKKSLWNPSL